MYINGIIAINRVQCIGDRGKMLWHEPAELAFFKRTTLNSIVVMGRRTFDSLKGLLPNRKHVVLTHDARYATEKLEQFGIENLWFSCDVPITQCLVDIENLAKACGKEHVFICGGSQVYTLFEPYIQRWYISHMRNEQYGDVKYTYFNRCDFTRRFFQSRFLVQHEKFMTVQYDELT